MFGKNPIRDIERDPDRLAVESMFYTLQGEGPFSGMPALFIRLAGCNLACHFCDTQFETQADNVLPWEEHARKVLEFPIDQRRLVVVTGGEPMRQNWVKLAALLLETGTQIIQVETAGTVWQDLTLIACPWIVSDVRVLAEDAEDQPPHRGRHAPLEVHRARGRARCGRWPPRASARRLAIKAACSACTALTARARLA
jgi:organic radical activating enzyme